MPKTFHFPLWLTGSPEEQKAEDQRQALALAAHGRGHLSEAERLVGRGALLETTARGNLEAAGDNDEAVLLAKSQLADALAMGGRFAEAAEIHPDPARKTYFNGVVTAMELPDDQKCDCSDREARVNDIDLAITPRFERARIFSSIHGDVISLVECSKCGHTNARPLRSRLLKHNDAIAQNEAMAKGTNVRFISDAQVLKKDAKPQV